MTAGHQLKAILTLSEIEFLDSNSLLDFVQRFCVWTLHRQVGLQFRVEGFVILGHDDGLGDRCQAKSIKSTIC